MISAASDIGVGDIGFVLDGHHGDSGIDFGWEGHLNHILLPIYTDPHALLDISWGKLITQLDNELSDLFDIDHVFVLFAICDYLITTSHLQGLLRCEFGISGQVPLSR